MKAQRRHEGEKRVRRVMRIFRQRHNWLEQRYPGTYTDDGELAKMMISTRVPCSCFMCGNPRRYFGEKTIQERRADEAFIAELETL